MQVDSLLTRLNVLITKCNRFQHCFQQKSKALPLPATLKRINLIPAQINTPVVLILLFDERRLEQAEMWRKPGPHREQTLIWNSQHLCKGRWDSWHALEPQACWGVPCLWGCLSIVQCWQQCLFTWLGQWTRDTEIQALTLFCWEKRKRGSIYTLWRCIWKASADPGNGGDTWAFSCVLNLLSTPKQSPAYCPLLGWKQMCCIHLDLGSLPLINILERFPLAVQVYFFKHCRGMKKWGSLCLSVNCRTELETSALASAQPDRAAESHSMATKALDHGCYQS